MRVEDLLQMIVGLAMLSAWLKGTIEIYEEGGMLPAIVMQLGLVWFFLPLWMMAEKHSLPVALPAWAKGAGWLGGTMGLSLLVTRLMRRRDQQRRAGKRGQA